MVTLAVLGVLATLVVPVAQTALQRSRENELRLALRELRAAIDLYKKAHDEGRIGKGVGDSGYPNSLELLVEGVIDARDPGRGKIFFLRRVPRDPMHADRALRAAQTWGKRSYASEASDPHEGDDVYDVYSKSAAVGLDGTPYRQW